MKKSRGINTPALGRLLGEVFQDYYKNKIHTVIRYLTNLNEWADSKQISDELFKKHKLRVVIFYLAIENIVEHHKNLLSNPCDYFLNKLAYLARKGNLNNHSGEDDLRADKPDFEEKTFISTCFVDYAHIWESQLNTKKPAPTSRTAMAVRFFTNLVTRNKSSMPIHVSAAPDKNNRRIIDLRSNSRY